MQCRVSGQDLVEIVDLGDQYVSDFVPKEQILTGPKSPLKLGLGRGSGLLQLFDSLERDVLYRKYWYQSGINEQMRRDLSDVGVSALKWGTTEDGDCFLDIASNDGTLLGTLERQIPPDSYLIGIDPSDVAARDPWYRTGNVVRRVLVNDYFSADAYYNACFGVKPAKIITCCAMFYDLDEPLAFLQDVHSCLAEDGIFVLQLSYTPLMLVQNAFDNIGHEHIAYWCFENLSKLLTEAGFLLLDAELNDVNCGSLRVYVGKSSSVHAPTHVQQLGAHRIEMLLEHENLLHLDCEYPYVAFADRIKLLKDRTLAWLEKQRAIGKTVIGYGASTKGNTLLQTYGIGPELLPSIAERDYRKVDLYTVGTGIPIISEVEMRQMKPDYLFVLPWTFVTPMMRRETELLKEGTKFVVPLPDIQVMN